MKKFIMDNSLSIVMYALFVLSFIGLIFTGFAYQTEQASEHHRQPEAFNEYIVSGEFVEAVFENWESEFLQMGALVVLTIWLVQKGAADSRKLRGKNPVDTSSRYSIIHASTWRTRKKGIKEFFYANSLSMTLFGLFILSFILHAAGGAAAANEEAKWHGGEQRSVFGYVTTSQFWFESFQNWQSEFLSVGTLLVLSIFLRQRFSPESKPVGSPNKKTGE